MNLIHFAAICAVFLTGLNHGFSAVGQDPLPGRELSVGGEVNNPGRVPYKRGITISEAITQSGGFTKRADRTRVQLQRNGKKYIYDLNRPAHAKLKVYPDDTIIVPRK